MKEELWRIIEAQGGDLFGIADLNTIKEAHPATNSYSRELTRGVVIGIRLSDALIDTLSDHPTPLYFHHYRQINAQLDRLALQVTSYLQRQGWQALPFPSSQIVNWDRFEGEISHRLLGEYAGLGWRGRNNLLVNPDYGARVRYVSILTNCHLLEPANKLSLDCDDCQRCLASCPAGAITKERFDLNKCFNKLEEFRRKIKGISQHICGLCVKACVGKKNITAYSKSQLTI